MKYGCFELAVLLAGLLCLAPVPLPSAEAAAVDDSTPVAAVGEQPLIVAAIGMTTNGLRRAAASLSSAGRARAVAAPQAGPIFEDRAVEGLLAHGAAVPARRGNRAPQPVSRPRPLHTEKSVDPPRDLEELTPGESTSASDSDAIEEAGEVDVAVEDAAPAGPAIVKVDIEGIDRVEESAIRIHIEQKAGRRFDVAAVDADVKRVYAMGFFDQVWVTREDVSGGVQLVFHVRERPYVTDIVYEGFDAVDIDDVEAAILLRPRTVFDPQKAWEGARAVEKLYEEEGYPDAVVRYELETDDNNEAVVAYKVDEGKVVRVQEITFEGVQAFSPRKLRGIMATREEWWLSWFTGAGTLNEEELSTDVERLTAFYYDNGYIHVRIDEPDVERRSDGLYITIRVEEGGQFRVGNIEFEGDVLLPQDELIAASGLEPGTVFKPSRLREGIFGLTEAYGNLGYAFAEVVPATQVYDDTGLVDVVFRLRSGGVVGVRRIDVRGNTKTRDYVIRRELRLHEGEKFSGTGLKESRDRIRRLGFFDDVSIESARAEEEDKVDLIVNVKEGRTGTFSAGAGFSSADQLLLNARILERNLFGRGQSVLLNVDFGSRRQNFRLGFTEPWFAGIPLSLGVELFDWEFRFDRFSRGGSGFALRAGYPLWELGFKDVFGLSLDNTRVGLEYRIEDAKINGISKNAPPSVWAEEGARLTSSLRPSFIRNTIDHPFDPSAGSRQSFSAEFAGFGGETDFIKIEINGRWFIPVYETEAGSRFVYSFAGALGYGLGDSGPSGQELPLFERYFPGGISTVRGFDNRSLGPQEEVPDDAGFLIDIEPIGGSQQLILNNEFIFPVLADAGLKGVLFFDAGNAFSAKDGIDMGNLRYAVGAGIRWLSPFGPVRIEFGFPLNAEPNERTRQVLFSFGAPF